MGKKSKRNRSSSSSGKQPQTITEDEDKPRVHPSLRTPEEETIDNLRFQDPFVEEYEVDEDEWEDDDDDNHVAMKPKSSSPSGGDENKSREMEEIVQAWNPFSGEPLQPGEQLEMDASAYKMYHALQHEWPALSFDFVRDDFGEARARFPHTLTAVLGTQADTPSNNSLTVVKISDLCKVHVETDDDILGEELNNDDNDDDDESDDEEEDEEMDPVMEHHSIPHRGGVNRVRVMPQRPDIVATWSDTGHVHLFNIAAIRQRFQPKSGLKGPVPSYDPIPSKPFFSYANVDRGVEGFALDWSPVKEGQLATGDCHGSIHVWQPRPESGHAISHLLNQSKPNRSSGPILGAEDIQWSPTEGTVLAAAFGGGTVRIFDTRKPGQAMIGHTIHKNSDVNVLSWNRLVTNLLATGGDDGTLAVWDLRHFSSQKAPQPLARFTPHKSPITSVEWHPTDESMLVASDDVGTYIYDLSVEEDDIGGSSGEGVPPQLLFVHCGSEQFKEVHWHPQISSCVMTTALTGLSVFIPSNL